MSDARPSERVFRALSEALQDASGVREPEAGQDLRLDYTRAGRKGVPEVILAQGKTPEQTIEAARRQLQAVGRVLVSRVSPELTDRLREVFADEDLDAPSNASVVRIAHPDDCVQPTGGRLAILTAGTSDWPAAQEARMVAEEMGCRVEVIADVGVAGLHRLIRPLRAVLDDGVDVIVVAAGMDGALPSVVAGLVPVPVIGLPTSVGYGFGGQGEAALMSMLQTCAPGLTVVNIDNGVGAGAAAALIANGAARARARPAGGERYVRER